jgi:molecular chaperone HtpG
MAAATSKLVSTAYIPNDLALSILSKLPLKSLKRFTCVKKSFSLLFQSPDFMNMFRTNFISKHNEDSENTRLILKEKTQMIPFPYTFCTFSGEKLEDGERLDCPPPFHEDDLNIGILGFASVNGTLCLYQGNYHDTKIVLWNPATTEFKVVPPSFQPYDNIEFKIHPCAFGYDRVRHDYKLIRVASYPLDFEGNWVEVPDKDSYLWDEDYDHIDWDRQVVKMNDPFWEIYSLKSNSWRKIDRIEMDSNWADYYPVNLNEFCHWEGPSNDIVSFDFINEIFIATTLPSVGFKRSRKSGLISLKCRLRLETYLAGINGSIAFISNIVVSRSYHIWILGELGVKESWIKLFVVDAPCRMHPFGVGIKSFIFFKKHDDDGIAWYDLSTQRTEEIKVKGESVGWDIIVYKENLLSFEGINI